MDQGYKTKRQKNPRERAGILSIITFFFTYDTFKKGTKRDLEEKDIYEVMNNYKAKKLGDLLEKEWEKEKKNKAPSVLKLVLRPFGLTFLRYGVMQMLMKTVLVLISPTAMGKVVSYFSPDSTVTKSEALYYACVTIIINFVDFIYSHNYSQLTNGLGLRVRTALSSLLYRKALRLSATSLGQVTAAKIVTLITKDVTFFNGALILGNDLWIGVIQTAIIAYLMYRQIGVAALVGLSVFIVLIPLQIYFARRISIYRTKSSAKTDERLRVIQESLTAIKIIKMYTWEKFFSKIVTICRNYEMRTLRKIDYIKALSSSLGTLSSNISFFICIIVYAALGNTITAEKAFVVLGYYSTLSTALAIYIPEAILQFAELQAAIIRIRHVMMAAEVTVESPAPHKSEITSNPQVSFNQVTLVINGKTVLESISLKVEKGLTTITGNVGSGKSVLLGLILQEISPTKGTVDVQGTVSYASQEPWLFPGSIRQNILFGQEYKKERYDKVIQVCCLKTDLDLLPKGDYTIAGDRGLNLSKGQQARINLARAIYKDCSIYLLDDCLSALDAHVSQHVFEGCVKGFLKDKVCILITHYVQHLQQADKIIVLNEGTAETICSFKELEEKGATFETVNMNQAIETLEENTPIVIEDAEAEDNKQLLLSPERKVYGEDQKVGKVNFEVYWSYINYGGGISVVVGLLIVFLITQVASSYSNILIGKWVDVETNLSSLIGKDLTNTPEFEVAKQRHSWTLFLFTSVIIVATIFTIGRAFCFFMFSSVASMKLHKATFKKIMGSTMKFFDIHRVGNVINRFSRDVLIVDEDIPYLLFNAFRVLLMILGIFYVILNATAYSLIPTFVLMVILFLMCQYYLPTSRSLKRLESIVRSPVIGHLKASLEGLQTVRANKVQLVLREEFDKYLDVYHSAYYMYMSISICFGLFMDFLCLIYTSLIMFFFLIIDTGAMAGNVGVALTQALSLTGMLQWGFRNWAEIEIFMGNVERVLEYSTAEQEQAGGRRPGNWPKEGRIVYKNVTLRYREKDAPILKDISFTIEPMQNIGIVGRTGAGKSSIIATLFRLYDVEGSITIDNENIKDVSLDTLRSRISIIPQDPVLFSGTIRDNLDPFRMHSDEDLWKVLEDVKLKEVITNLEQKITDSGNHFSTGQRQLICLARTVIQKNKILILDEATANVDPQTDALIQRTIKEKFSECTVLTVAHRLDTVMKSDKVMVIDNGTVLEFDVPEKLLESGKGAFYGMIKTAGLLLNDS